MNSYCPYICWENEGEWEGGKFIKILISYKTFGFVRDLFCRAILLCQFVIFTGKKKKKQRNREIMICHRKHFQQGQLSLSSRSSCEFNKLNEKLLSQKCLSNFRNGLQVLLIMQSPNYGEKIGQDYQRDERDKK